MRRLSDADLGRMAAGTDDFDAKKIRAGVKKQLKIKDLRDGDISPRATVVDCHGKTVDAAFDEISAKIREIEQGGGRYGDELLVVTGKSGVIKRLFHTGITDGPLAGGIKSWRMVNDGAYKIKIKTE
jgi:DNA-nicking Smr family endonuclease